MRARATLVPGIVLGALLAIAACSAGEGEQAPAAGCAPACPITIDTVWSSDPTNEDLSITYRPIERGDSLVAVNAFENWYLAVLGPRGETVRKVGRKGQGPGEYRSISAIDLHRDGALFIYDRRWLTILDSTLAVVSTANLPVTVERGIVFDDRTSVVDGTRRVGDTTFALNLIDAEGKLLASFDTATSQTAIRFIAHGRDNSVWATSRLPNQPRYEINRWEPRTGQRLQTITDTPSWLTWTPPDSTSTQRACARREPGACDRMEDEQRPPHPPMPVVFHMSESPDGLLWVVAHTADARWREGSRSELNKLHDTVLEVRDATSGALIGSRVLDQYSTGFSDRGNVVLYELDESAQPKHVLVRPSVDRSARRPDG